MYETPGNPTIFPFTAVLQSTLISSCSFEMINQEELIEQVLEEEKTSLSAVAGTGAGSRVLLYTAHWCLHRGQFNKVSTPPFRGSL